METEERRAPATEQLSGPAAPAAAKPPARRGPSASVRFVRRHKKLVAALFGLALTLALLVLVEVVSAIILKMQPAPGPDDPNPANLSEELDGHLYDQDDRVGHRAARNATVRNWKDSPNGPVYDYMIHTDEHGRRVSVVPEGTEAGRDKFVMTLGCSYTFGEGVEDDQTLASQLAARLPEHQPYNYGFKGYGTANVYLQVSSGLITEGVDEKQGVAIYTFIDDQMDRTMGTMRILTTWGKDLPSLEWGEEEGKVRHRGRFRKTHKDEIKVYDLLSKSNFLKLVKFDWPRKTDARIRRQAELIAAARDEFHKHYPDSEFVVVLYPWTVAGPRMKPYLEERGVRVLDYHERFEGDNWQQWFYQDYHPRAKAHEVLADWIVEDLGLAKNPE